MSGPPRGPDARVAPARRTWRDQRGFTLIELLVVIIVFGLLVGLVGPRLWGRVGESKTATARAQIELLGAALDQYRLDVGRYPDTSQGLDSLMKTSGSRTGTAPTSGRTSPRTRGGSPTSTAAARVSTASTTCGRRGPTKRPAGRARTSTSPHGAAGRSRRARFHSLELARHPDGVSGRSGRGRPGGGAHERDPANPGRGGALRRVAASHPGAGDRDPAAPVVHRRCGGHRITIQAGDEVKRRAPCPSTSASRRSPLLRSRSGSSPRARPAAAPSA